jgi:hypothetical protein
MKADNPLLSPSFPPLSLSFVPSSLPIFITATVDVVQ